MRIVWTISSGIAFTMLLVVLPMIHVTHWNGAPPTVATLGLAALPFVVIVFALLRPSAWTAVWLFPVAHLPVLVNQPELTGPLVYSGPEGLVALGTIIGLGGLWIWKSLELPTAEDRRTAVTDRERVSWFRLLPVAATTVAIAIWIAFVWPVLSAAQAGRAQASVAVIGLAAAVIVLVSGRWVTRDLGELSGDARSRRRWTVALLKDRQPRPGQLWLSFAVTVIGGLMVLALFQ